MKFDFKEFVDRFRSDEELSVGGIAVGTSVDSLPFSDIDSSTPDFKKPYCFRGEKIFRKLDDDSEVELNAKECYDVVRQSGGHLKTGGITWVIENRHIKRYIVNEQELERYNLNSENHIIIYFGNPDFKLMSSLGIVYHFVKSQLAVVWSGKEGKLKYIRVGDFTSKSGTDLTDGVLYISGKKKIHMTKIEQRYSYDGLISGLPDSDINDRIISHALSEAYRLSYSNTHLIEPQRTKVKYTSAGRTAEYEKIPGIRCIAAFKCYDPAKDEKADQSKLSLVWFQNNFAMPIEENVRNAIKALDWNELAMDESYDY